MSLEIFAPCVLGYVESICCENDCQNWSPHIGRSELMPRTCPQVSLNLESKSSHVRKANKKAMLAGAGADYRSKTGHAFSAENPYGRRDPQDKRQFSR